MTRRILIGVVMLLLGSGARAQVSWTLTTSDFHSQSVALKSIDPAGVHVAPAAGGNDTTVPLDRFLDLSRTAASAAAGGKFVLHLVGDDQLGGAPSGFKGNSIVWDSPTLGQIALPTRLLVAMTRPGSPAPDSPRREDSVLLANGDTLRGIIAGFADGKLTVQTDAGNSDVPVSAVAQIQFASTAGAAAPQQGFRLRFDDNSSIVAGSLAVSGDKVQISLGKDALAPIDLGRVVTIEQVNGPVSWLSSRTPSEDLYQPFIGSPRMNTARMNRNWTGLDPIRFNAQQFVHGIGVHSYSRLTWKLDGSYRALRTRYAIDTHDANAKADVTVRILLDGKAVYEQQHVRAGTLSPVVTEDLGSAKTLSLEVDYGDNLDTQDRLNWIEPALLKEKPGE